MNRSIETLFAFADRAGLELVVWSWQALVILVCVWAGLRLFRVRTPALRHQIWFISLLAVLTLPLWPLVLPKSSLPHEHTWKSPALSYAAELPRLVIVPTALVHGPSLTQDAARPSVPNRQWLVVVLPGIFCLWIVGALIAFFRSGRGYIRLVRASRHACPVTPAELGSSVRLPGPVSLSLSTDVSSPLLLGLRLPLILLPHDLADWTSTEERDVMIAHELEHLARFDHFTNLLPNTLNPLFFFHPLVRYACRQLCLEREMACDDRVIGHGADATMYAESLVKAAERSLKGKLDDLSSYSFHQPAFFTTKQALERRIEMILNTDRVRLLARGWRYLILPALLIFALAGVLVPDRPATAQQLQKKLDNVELRQMAQEMLTMRQSQASIKKQNRRDEPPPPPPPPPKRSTSSLSDLTAAAKKLRQGPSDQNQVAALLRESNDAALRHDTEFFERVLADDYQGIGIKGEVVNKAQVITQVKHPFINEETHHEVNISKIDLDELRLMGEGNSIVATYISTVYYEEDGKKGTVQFRNTDNFIKRQGEWQFVRSHASMVR
jgi:beta-lactamase regulating signal transducer with metallopeptidase domain